MQVVVVEADPFMQTHQDLADQVEEDLVEQFKVELVDKKLMD